MTFRSNGLTALRSKPTALPAVWAVDYIGAMDNDDHPPMPSQAELSASLERSRAQLAAGEVVDGQTVLNELNAAIARMEAKQTAKARATA